MGQPAKAELTGHVPTVRISKEDALKAMGTTEEKLKYEACWAVDDYRKYSPGEECVEMFVSAVEDIMDEPDKSLIDWGCGTGRASALLLDHGFDVTMVDFAANCLDPEVEENLRHRFVEHDITKKIKLRSKFGYCCDVMEHLPPAEVDDALEVILENSEHVFFQIATTPDHFGKHPDINHPLHLSVHGYQWWLKKLVSHGCIIHRSVERQGHVIFFVSGYTGFSFDKMTHNTEFEEIIDHMKANAETGAPNILAYEEQKDIEVVVIGGGPSLKRTEDQLRTMIERKAELPDKVKFVTVNGSYPWFKENFPGIPATQFMIDARAFNARFIDEVRKEDIYIIASQCWPGIMERIVAEGGNGYLWQVNLSTHTMPLLEELWGEMYKDWFPCPGGSTVMLRVLPQLQQMGFRNIHVFGFDSCLMGEEHHAYNQPENDIHDGSVLAITPEIEGVEPREFRVHPWMLAQAKEFFDMKDTFLRHLDITVYGDGLIAYLMEHGADTLKE